MSQDQIQPETSEQSPLLGKSNGPTQDDGPNLTAGPGVEADSREGHDNETDDPLVKEPSTQELLAAVSGMYLGTFFAALGTVVILGLLECKIAAYFILADMTIIATLTAPISSTFNSLSLLSWLATGYLISNAACQPLSGKLTDIFSRRYGLIFSNIFFGIGTLVCGLAQHEWAMILGRVVAGIGGGGLSCISTFVTSDLVPLRRRGVWQGKFAQVLLGWHSDCVFSFTGYGNLVFGLGMGLGGPFGGWLNDALNWRWAFLIQIPFIVLSTILVWFLIKIPVRESTKPPLSRVDFLGASLLVAALVLFLLGLNTGGNQLPWSHPLVVTSLVLAFATFLAFLYVEDRVAPEPVIPVRLVVKTRTVLAACLTNWFGTMAAFLFLYYVPLYLQVRGLSSTQSGFRIIPFAVGTSVGSLGTGVIMRRSGRYYSLNIVVMAIFILGAVLMCTFTLESPMWMTFLYPVPMGFGYGGLLTITLIAMISSVAHQHQAVITAASYAFRSTGSTIGITIASAVFQNILTNELREKYGHMPHSDEIIGKIKDSLEGVKHLPPGWKSKVVLGFYMDAFRGAFLAGLGMSVIATISSFFMREHILHHRLSRQ